MHLVIAGKNNIAVDVLQHCLERFDREQLSVVLNRTEQKRNTWQKSLGFYAERAGVEVIDLDSAYEKKDLVFLSLEYDRIIRPDKFASSRLYNIHFSLLPAYKGMYTSLLPILHGRSESGVTLHRIDAGIDTGDVIGQDRFDIAPDETCRSLYFKYLRHGTQLVLQNVNRLLDGEPSAKPQSASGSSYFGQGAVDFSKRSILLNQTAEQASCQARSLTFREYQMPEFEGQPVAKLEVLEERSRHKSGKVLERTPREIIACTVDFNVKMTLDYMSELYEAASTDADDRAARALDYVCDINESNSHGWTALMIAAFHGSSRVVGRLLKNGADVHRCNLNGTSPLMYAKDGAIRTGNMSVVEQMIMCGADVQHRDIHGKTVADYLDRDSPLAWPFPR